MEKVSCIVRHAQQLAREVDAWAVMVYADAMTERRRRTSPPRTALDSRTILVTRSRSGAPPPCIWSAVWVSVPDVHMTRAGQVRAAVLSCLARGLLHKGDRIVS